MGIILFELLYPMKTINEVCTIIPNVRKHEFPKDFIPCEVRLTFMNIFELYKSYPI